MPALQQTVLRKQDGWQNNAVATKIFRIFAASIANAYSEIGEQFGVPGLRQKIFARDKAVSRRRSSATSSGTNAVAAKIFRKTGTQELQDNFKQKRAEKTPLSP